VHERLKAKRGMFFSFIGRDVQVVVVNQITCLSIVNCGH